jgi:hypothetical protein
MTVLIHITTVYCHHHMTHINVDLYNGTTIPVKRSLSVILRGERRRDTMQITQAVIDYMRRIGKRGGAAGRGAAKARPSCKMRAAVRAYWASPEGQARQEAARKRREIKERMTHET